MNRNTSNYRYFYSNGTNCKIEIYKSIFIINELINKKILKILISIIFSYFISYLLLISSNLKFQYRCLIVYDFSFVVYF